MATDIMATSTSKPTKHYSTQYYFAHLLRSAQEEAKIDEEKADKIKMDTFEKANSEWCEGQKEEIDERNKKRDKQEKSADVIRLKGNRKFAAKEFPQAVKLYKEAMTSTPYKTNILTNLAQCFCKLKEWDEAVEFCNRALHVDQQKNVKAFSRRAFAYDNLGREEEAVADLNEAVKIDKDNKDCKKQLEDLLQRMATERMEKKVGEMVVDESKRVEAIRGGKATAPGEAATREALPPPPLFNSTSVKEASKEWIERGMEAMKNGEAFDEPPPVSDFEMLDQFVERIAKGEGGQHLMETPAGTTGTDTDTDTDTDTGSDLQGPTVAELLATSLNEQLSNRVYFRTSKNLNKLISLLISSLSKTGNGDTSIILAALSAAILGEKKSKVSEREK